MANENGHPPATGVDAYDQAPTSEQRLGEIARRWHMPLERLPGDTVSALADRLLVAIEHTIALMLLDLEEISTLDLEEYQS